MGVVSESKKIVSVVTDDYTHSKFNLNDIVIMMFFIYPVDSYIFTFILWDTKI
jgi:hypothetical protein